MGIKKDNMLIMVSRATAKFLVEQKSYKRETYDDVIQKLLIKNDKKLLRSENK